MSLAVLESLPKSRLKALLDHFGHIDDPREPWRIAHPRPEVLLLVVCGTIYDCEDYDVIAAWGNPLLINGERFLDRLWPNILPERFEDLRLPFLAVATDY